MKVNSHLKLEIKCLEELRSLIHVSILVSFYFSCIISAESQGNYLNMRLFVSVQTPVDGLG